VSLAIHNRQIAVGLDRTQVVASTAFRQPEEHILFQTPASQKACTATIAKRHAVCPEQMALIPVSYKVFGMTAVGSEVDADDYSHYDRQAS
jgi:hypothetical protein